MDPLLGESMTNICKRSCAFILLLNLVWSVFREADNHVLKPAALLLVFILQNNMLIASWYNTRPLSKGQYWKMGHDAAADWSLHPLFFMMNTGTVPSNSNKLISLWHQALWSYLYGGVFTLIKVSIGFTDQRSLGSTAIHHSGMVWTNSDKNLQQFSSWW